jgi:hypothetical protein
MIEPKVKPVLGPVVERIQNWIMLGDGKVLMDSLEHKLALLEVEAAQELGKIPPMRLKEGMPVGVLEKLSLANKYRNTLEILKLCSEQQSEFITTDLPIPHA